ncbi:MAG: GerAB/ArcD/ProY family transporter [Ignavibacteriales bacterium]
MRGEGQGTGFPEGHIDWIEAVGIIVTYDVTKAFLIFPERMARDGITAGWTIPVFSALISILWLWPLVVVLRSHPGKNLVEVTGSLAGRAAALLVGLVYYAYILGLGATGAREITSALKVVVLPLTPASFLLGLGLVISLYIAYQGIEVLGRLCVIHATATIAVIILLSLIWAKSWNARLLFPLLGPGPGRLAVACVSRQAMYGEVLGLGIVAAYLRDPAEETGKTARWCLALSAFTLTLTVVTAMMVFPYPALVRIPMPFLRVSRLIYIGRFFQRLDALFVLVWLGAGMAKVSVGHYLAAVTLATALGLKTYKPLVILSGLIGFTIAWLIPDYSTAIILDFDIVRPYGNILLAGWPITLFLLDRWKGRNRGRTVG